MLHLYAIPILLAFFHLCYNIKVWGKKHVPARGWDNKGIIIMANHRSHLDPFLVGLAAFPRFYKPFFYPADAKLWKLSLFRPILHGMNCFPVFKGSKKMDIIKYHIALVKNGGSVCYFPEGARSKADCRSRPAVPLPLGPPQLLIRDSPVIKSQKLGTVP